MIVERIKFRNFMAFYGDVVFELPVVDNRNVTIIYAPNDVGKSCFFKGITFAFHGAERGQSLKDLINQNAWEEKDYKAFVSISGVHNGKEVKIERAIAPRSATLVEPNENDLEEKLFVWENNNKVGSVDPYEVYDYLNSILHKEAAKYFFFDGEKIQEYNIATGADYEEAITRILGLKEIENARNDFKKIADDYVRERDSLLRKQNIANDMLRDKQKLEEELEELREELKAVESDLKDVNRVISELESELSTHEEIREQIEERQRLREEIKDLENRIADKRRKAREQVAENGVLILGAVIFEKLKNATVQQGKSNHLMSYEVANFLEQMLKSDVCICGKKLGVAERNHLEGLLQPFKSENARRSMEEKAAYDVLQDYYPHGIKAKERYRQLYGEIIELRRDLNNKQGRLFDLNQEVGNFDDESAKRISDEIARQEQKAETCEEKLIRLDTIIKEKRKQLGTIEEELKEISVGGQELKEVQSKLELAKTLHTAFDEYLKQLALEKKKEVEQKASEIFLQLTNKPNKYGGIVLEDNFDLKLRLSDGSLYTLEKGRSLNPSTGQSKIISLSFIAAINQSSNSVAPIVVDNPVGLFSEEHRKRVVQYIPYFGRQVIFMVTQADLSAQYRRIIQPYVNCEYELEDESTGVWNKTRIKRKEVFVQ